MTGLQIETWIETRERPDGRTMTASYAASMSGCHRATLWRWISNAGAEVRPTRALREFVDWMRDYDRANPRRRTADAPGTPKAISR